MLAARMVKMLAMVGPLFAASKPMHFFSSVQGRGQLGGSWSVVFIRGLGASNGRAPTLPGGMGAVKA